MIWQDFKQGGFGWSIADGALVMGPLEDGRTVVHVSGEEPFATLHANETAKGMAEGRLNRDGSEKPAETK